MNRLSRLRSNLHRLARSVLPLLIILSATYAMAHAGVFSYFDTRWIDRYIAPSPIIGAFYFIGVFALLSAIGMPRQLIAFVGGYAFDIVDGTLISTCSVTLGAIVSFYFARLILPKTMLGKLLRRSPSVDRLLMHQTFSKAIVIRLFPVGNNLATNLMAGCANTPAANFFAGSFLGYIPQMLVFSIAGSGMSVQSSAEITLSVVLLITSTVTGIYLYRRDSAERDLIDAKARISADSTAIIN